MKAVVKTMSGFDNMQIMDMDEPIVEGDLIKIKIAYTGVCGSDLHAFKGEYSGTRIPVILGHEFSGIIVEVGPKVSKFKIGDRVTSETTFKTCMKCSSCESKNYNLCSDREGIGTQINGGMAQYLVSREESVHLLPENVSLLSGSLTEPLACAVHATMEKGDVKKGDVVCVFGAGAIGLFVAWVAKLRGAYVFVAGLDTDAERFEIAKKIGIDQTIDQTNQDLNEVIQAFTSKNGADKVFECSGSIHALNKGLEIVKRKGVVVQMGVFPDHIMPVNTSYILHKEIKYIGSRSQRPSSWIKTIELMREGIIIPEKIVTGIYSLDDWRTAFDTTLSGAGIKAVIKCNDDFEI